MSTFRTVFLGTPGIAEYCLNHLIEDDHYEVVGVVTQPDRPSGRKMQRKKSLVKQLAEKHQIPVLSPESVNAPETLETIHSWNAECAVVVAFGQLMSQKFLDLFPQKVVNIHASLLPRWRGAAPIQRAIMAGDTETGVCLQVMVKELDAGDLIGTRKIKIIDSMDSNSLIKDMLPLCSELLEIDFCDYLRGNLSAQPQKSDGLTYAKKLLKSEGEIDWSLPARQIFNNLRGLVMGPGSFTIFNGKKIKIHSVELGDGSVANKPGAVVIVGEGFFEVCCGDGVSLRVFRLQPESKPILNAGDFVRGYSLNVGDAFEKGKG